jgi:hypothetical protein
MVAAGDESKGVGWPFAEIGWQTVSLSGRSRGVKQSRGRGPDVRLSSIL